MQTFPRRIVIRRLRTEPLRKIIRAPERFINPGGLKLGLNGFGADAVLVFRNVIPL
jgi:hypothetical protein